MRSAATDAGAILRSAALLLGVSFAALNGCQKKPAEERAEVAPAPPAHQQPDRARIQPGALGFSSFGVLAEDPATQASTPNAPASTAKWLNTLELYLVQQEAKFSACFAGELPEDFTVRLRFRVGLDGTPLDLDIEGGSDPERGCVRLVIEQWKLPPSGDEHARVEVTASRPKRRAALGNALNAGSGR
ncbi:hypothetical protein [Nannocystis radixulma]|jgi:hypothetical protein|uniref:Lipoprotein n=1 Tax=Nannocystis radixulma TaxID=2995305 RepID=A0ABT5BR03_9BACT|nr:hypothetical protein [Nannocystis radixulma]MDC0676000.1 hypothetical protein [Nannocystis radixulma]